MESTQKQPLLTELHYLPNIEYFSKLVRADSVILEANEYYTKQTFRNRTHILGANKVETLIVPILNGHQKTLIKDIKIDYSDKWTLIHWRTLTAAYNKSPFFEFFAEDFKAIFDKKPNFLWDLNNSMLTLCLKFLRLNKTISQTETYEKLPKNDIIDERNTIIAKNRAVIAQSFKPMAYKQNFGNDFVPNLSIIDLMSCQGSKATEILKNSVIN